MALGVLKHRSSGVEIVEGFRVGGSNFLSAHLDNPDRRGAGSPGGQRQKAARAASGLAQPAIAFSLTQYSSSTPSFVKKVRQQSILA